MEWMVYIAGDDFNLQELSKLLTSPKLCLIKEENEYYLKATSFNQLDNSGEVRNKVEDILSLINGAARLALGTRKPLTTGVIKKIKDDGAREGFCHVTDQITFRDAYNITTVSNDGIVQEFHQSSQISNWVKVAQSNENVAKVLRLLGNFDYDWVNLYRILEVVMKDVGGTSNIIKRGWATDKSITRFKRTAQSPEVIGDLARHGIQKDEPPEDSMTVSEAKSFIETILHKWLRSKIEKL